MALAALPRRNAGDQRFRPDGDSANGGGNYRNDDRATTVRDCTFTGHSAGSTSVLTSG
jgi:hypothetical protein